MPDAMETLRDNVTRLMKARDWSQHTMARKSGVSQSAVGYVMRYRDPQDKRPGLENIEMMAKAFGLQAWQMLCPIEEQPEAEPVDRELLTAAIRTAAETFRMRGTLPDDARLAAAAAFLYRRVHEGTSLKRAAKTVAEQLTRTGMNLAGNSDGPKKGERPRGFAGKGTTGRRKARAE
jgi:transcriptional regulator with XRE-family HTH domain